MHLDNPLEKSMTIVPTVRFAFKAARYFGHSPIIGALWALEDLRGLASEACYNAGVPALLLEDIAELRQSLLAVEYDYKSPWPELLLSFGPSRLCREVNQVCDQAWQ